MGPTIRRLEVEPGSVRLSSTVRSSLKRKVFQDFLFEVVKNFSFLGGSTGQAVHTCVEVGAGQAIA